MYETETPPQGQQDPHYEPGVGRQLPPGAALPPECGQFVLGLMDTYGTGMSVIIIAMFELIAIMWVYGVRTSRPCSVSLRAGISR